MKAQTAVLWEIALIIASVLIFRGAWLLLDRFFGADVSNLVIELLIGVALASACLYVLSKPQTG
ncbi:MAG: hypothetical protein QW390_03990 [Candidatus Bathyarchaeia archaeon]